MPYYDAYDDLCDCDHCACWPDYLCCWCGKPPDMDEADDESEDEEEI